MKIVIVDTKQNPPTEHVVLEQVWLCPYCQNEIGEHASCCGEDGRAEWALKTQDDTLYSENDIESRNLKLLMR